MFILSCGEAREPRLPDAAVEFELNGRGRRGDARAPRAQGRRTRAHLTHLAHTAYSFATFLLASKLNSDPIDESTDDIATIIARLK